MDKNLQLVQEFHDVFLIPSPKELNIGGLTKRFPFFVEEVTELRNELVSAEGTADSIFKELCDVQYTLDSLFISYGVADKKAAAMAEVHRSNMSKLDDKGEPVYREDGKIMKSNRFSPADLSKVLFE